MTDGIDALPSVPVPPLGKIGIWSSDFYEMTPDELASAAAELDDLGYGAVWIPDFVAKEPFIYATLLLHATSRLTVATGIANIWTRDPAAMHSAAASLNTLYDNRFLLGLGISHAPLVSGILDDAYVKPLTRMTRYVHDIDKTVARMAAMGRAASRQPRVIAALGPKMLELARDASAGAHPYLTTPEHTGYARQLLGEGPLLLPEQAVVVSDDLFVVRERGRTHLKGYLQLPNYTNNWKRLSFTDADLENGGSDRLVDAMIAGGKPDRIRERVFAHLEAGADHVCIQVLNDDPTGLRADWRTLASVLLG